MVIDQSLFNSACELIKLLDKQATDILPQEIVDVVKLHSKLAVGSAWIPVPGADVAAGAANIWGMYARINSKIGIPFGENAMKSIASGVATNLAGYVAMSGVASALKFVPGLGTVGGALIMSASLYSLTLTSGYVYLQALCKLVGKQIEKEISVQSIQDAVNGVLEQKDTIKNFFEEAKKTYKK